MNRRLRAMTWRITDNQDFQLVAAGVLFALCVSSPLALWWVVA